LGWTQQALFAQQSQTKPEVRRFHFLEVNPTKLNFAFGEFTSRWFVSQADYENFYLNNTRNVDVPADILPIDWSSEALLTIFWKSEDGVIRMPAFVGSEVRETQDDPNNPDSPVTRTLVLHFLMNKPCFGIITDVSPAVFMPFRFADLRFKDIKIESDPSRITNCMGNTSNSPTEDPETESSSSENE